MEIALLMGSFNPVHRGHLAVARYVIGQGLADEVWFVVSPQNPLKSAQELAPFGDRIAMVRLAVQECIQNDPALSGRLVVSDIEATLPQPSYTIQTIRRLKELYPENHFSILAGSDIARQLPQWNSPEELQRLVRFRFYPRGGGEASAEMRQAPRYDIDSTTIRRRIADGLPVREEILPAPVYDYIRRHGLYRPQEDMAELNRAIEREPEAAENYFRRGLFHYKEGNLSEALNDFNRTLELDPGHVPARQMTEMAQEIFSFRNMDLYNP